MRIALVHDDLVQWGGAEKVLLAISEVFPDAPIFTAVYDEKNKFIAENFSGKKIVTSFMQNIPGWRSLYKPLLPLYPIAFEQFDFSKFDLVISHTTRFAKSIITKPETVHISYCHTPPRFIWGLSGEKVSKLLTPLISFLKVYDQITSNRADFYLAGSKNAKKRIKKIYKKESEVLYPFVDLEKYNKYESFDGGYFLIISRLNRYKRIYLAVRLFNKIGDRLIIVGQGPQLNFLKGSATSNIEFIKSASERLLINLLAGCKALIITGEEDFGLTAIEAQAMGKPVIAFKRGGALETVKKGETGVFFNRQEVGSLIMAINKFRSLSINPEKCRENAEKFSKEIFKKNLLNFIEQIKL